MVVMAYKVNAVRSVPGQVCAGGPERGRLDFVQPGGHVGGNGT